MSLRLVVSRSREQLPAVLEGTRQAIAGAATGAIRDAAGAVKREGRAAIQRAGFGPRWQNALRVDVFPKAAKSIDAAAFVHHNIPYAGVFEEGATIPGRPFLWLPLPTVPQRIGRQRMTPKLYAERVGPLHSIRRPGKRPLLAGYVQGARAPTTGRKITLAQLRRGARDARRASASAAFGGKPGRFATVSVPLFVGIPSVRVRARFGLRAIYEKARQDLAAAFYRHLKVD